MTSSPPGGHIKLARKLFDPVHGDALWQEPRKFSRWEAWVDLIRLATFTARSVPTKYGPVALRRGEVITAVRQLADRWQWRKDRVAAFLDYLVADGRLAPAFIGRDASSAVESDAKRDAKAGRYGTVYLVVNYDTYQRGAETEPTNRQTQSGTRNGTQAGTRKKQVKQVREETTSDAPASETTAYDVLPKAWVDAAYDRWIARIGGLNYGLLRKGLLAFYRSAVAIHPTAEELVAAVSAFAEARDAVEPRWRDRWDVRKFAAELPTWVRLGGMPLVDEWGMPTERGKASGLFSEAA